MGHILLLLTNRYRVFDNYVKSIRRHVLIHVFVAAGVLLIIWGGGMGLFGLVFNFLKNQEPFGPPLIDRLMSMVLMAFFAMLIFSNLIVTLSTTYVSREVEYLMTMPLKMSQLFWFKLIESTFYSSWAFALMALPTFVAYGWALEAPLLFYPALILMLAPFIAIPAGLGALITMAVSAFFPARRARILALALGGVSIAITVALIRMMGGRAMALANADSDFSALMSMMSFGATPVLPNVWLVRGMQATIRGAWGEYLYWLAMLASTALMVGQICAWLIGPLYYRGWTLARESGSAGRVGRWGSVFDRLDVLFAPLPRHVRALVGKDVRVFWRDPVQWSQLLILFGLLVIYVGNITTTVPRYEGSLLLSAIWKARISFFNMGAACFVLSILSTRFMYPMLSLEGKEFWIVGLAPMKRTTLVWQKYWLSWTASTVLTLSIVVFSCFTLEVDLDMFLISVFTVLILSFGLTSLAVGLGATTPDFREDNPARIANGLGGTVNVILSLLYIGVVLALEGTLYLTYRVVRYWRVSEWNAQIVACVAALVLVNLCAIILPMKLGLKRWREMEF